MRFARFDGARDPIGRKESPSLPFETELRSTPPLPPLPHGYGTQTHDT
jgi:hypothetical protein